MPIVCYVYLVTFLISLTVIWLFSILIFFQFLRFILWIYILVFVWLIVLKGWELIGTSGRRSKVYWMKRTGNVIFRSLHQLWCDTPLKNNKFILFSNKFSSQAIVWVFRFHVVLDYRERWHLPTNRYWLQGEEEIFLDTATCAMAFRILRVNGYDISSGTLWFKRQPTRFWLFRKRLKSLFFFVDPFTWLSEDHFSSSPGGYVKTLMLSWDYLGLPKSLYILMNLFWRNKLSGPVISWYKNYPMVQFMQTDEIYMLAKRLFSAIKPFFTDSVMLDCIIQS